MHRFCLSGICCSSRTALSRIRSSGARLSTVCLSSVRLSSIRSRRSCLCRISLSWSRSDRRCLNRRRSLVADNVGQSCRCRSSRVDRTAIKDALRSLIRAQQSPDTSKTGTVPINDARRVANRVELVNVVVVHRVDDGLPAGAVDGHVRAGPRSDLCVLPLITAIDPVARADAIRIGGCARRKLGLYFRLGIEPSDSDEVQR